MDKRNFVTVTRLLLATLLLLLAASEGSAQTSPTSEKATSRAPMKMRGTTNAQRKAAAARAAVRRATAAAQQQARAQANGQVQGNAPVGPPGGAALTLDQLYFSGTFPNYANSPLPNPADTVNCAPPNYCGIRKFVDTLPGLNAANDLGQMIPVAVADTTTFPGSDYYEISLVQYQEKMHFDLPPTTLRGYVQTNMGQTIGPHYLGPLIIAQQNRPVRVKFTNNLPAGAGGNLFIPTDLSTMGAGLGMAKTMAPYLQNRATLHLHGGATPWISDGTPHQWTVPAGDFATTYSRGDSVQFVPDMWFDSTGTIIASCAGQTTCNVTGATNDPGPGSLTFYWTNQQSARLMFYHDHAYGTTRLNVYAGEAAGYLLQDPTEASLVAAGTIPADQIPLVIQDKTFVPPNPTSAPVYSIGILEVGSGYTAPTVSITGGGCTTGPTATATFGTITDPYGQFIYGAITGITLTSGGAGCTSDPLVTISDPTGTGAVAFASLATLSQQDPTWDTTLWGAAGLGQLWFPHVYMPNQWPTNPDGTGVNPMGRWDYASWFWPPFGNGTYQVRGEMPCGTLLNETCPGTPSVIAPAPNLDAAGHQNLGAGSTVSMVPEAFMDTPIVNGTAYPTVTVQPKAYRLRILSAGNDRTLNLSLFIACGTGGYTPSATAMPCPVSTTGVAGTEVGMVPAVATPGFPAWWTTDGRAGGVPDPAAMGPWWTVIGTEGGILPKPAVIPPSPVDYEYGRRSVTVLNVSTHSLMLMPAERADVIVDFSAFAGKTLLLYNDSPAPVPAFDTRYDYYTGDPDQTAMGGAPSTLSGYGPNTRTIMQINVAVGTPAPFNPAPLNTALPAAFKATQPVPVVSESAYNSVYGGTYPNTYATLSTKNALTFTPIGGTAPVTINFGMKTIQELFELNYGRMNATLGTELSFTNFNTQTTIPLGYVDPPTEIIQDSANVIGQPVGALGDGSQIWQITHNGVDSHAIHFHLFNVQVINRFGWDGTVRPPDATELGWKDTVRMNPLEIDFVALRPVSPTLPWPVPDSIRLSDVTMPAGPDPAISNVGPDGNAFNGGNAVINFGWEYVWHCHILGHEENDMMRAIQFQVAPPAPGNLLAASGIPPTVDLTFTDNSASEDGFTLERSTTTAFLPTDPDYASFSLAPSAPATSFGGTITFTDTTGTGGTTYYYRVQANDSFNPLSAYPPPFQATPLSSGWSNIASATAQMLTPAVTFTGAPASAAYGTNFTVYATTNANVMPTITSVGVCTVGAVGGTPGSASAFVTMTSGTGTCTLTANWAAAPPFNAAGPLTQITNAALAVPIVGFTGAPASAAYNISFTVTATTNSSTTPTITPTGVCSVGALGGTQASTTAPITMTSGTGTCTLTANWAADANYLAAGPLTQSTLATKIAPTVTFTGAPASQVYNTSFTVATTTNSTSVAVITASGACSIAGNVVTMTSGTGTCSLTANWAADVNYLAATASQSTAAAKAASATSIGTPTPNPSVVGQPVTVPFSVTGTGVGPTGTVTVNASSGESCTATLPATSCQLTFATTGTRTMTATYGGDTNFVGSASAPSASQNVIDFVLGLSPGSQTVNGGQKALYTMTATAIGGVAMPINLSCSINQTHYTCSISPTQVTPNGGTKKATVTIITVKGYGSLGPYTVTVNGVFGSGVPATGGLTHTATASLNVIK
jgi:FtsP/CotA-like multicopper oxidase with cupredoxin domain